MRTHRQLFLGMLLSLLACTCWAQDHQALQAAEPSSQVIVFELSIDGGPQAVLAAQSGTMATLEFKDRTYGVSPLLTEPGLIKFLLVEIKQLGDDRQSMKQLNEHPEAVGLGGSYHCENLPFTLKPLEIRSPERQ